MENIQRMLLDQFLREQPTQLIIQTTVIKTFLKKRTIPLLTVNVLLNLSMHHK